MKRTMLALVLVLTLASPAFAAGSNGLGAYSSTLAKAGVPAVCAKYGIDFGKTFIAPATGSKAAEYAGYTWEVRDSYYDMSSGVLNGKSVWTYNGARVEIWGFFQVVDFPPGQLTAG
jgi:hypothetical protein